jgi:hypothetical protein
MYLNLAKSNFFSLINLIIGIVTVVFSFLNTNVLEVGNKCGFDGRIYCLMAKGELVFEPYSRRTILPYLAGLLKFDLLYLNFYLLNAIFMIASTILLFLIIKKIVIKHSLLILGIFLVNPHTFRLLFSAPVLVDFLALTLILTVIYLFLGDYNFSKDILITGMLTILIFVRENISITFIFSSLIVHFILFFQKKISQRNLIFIVTKFMYFSIATYLAFIQPKIDPPEYVPKTEVLEVIKYWSVEIVSSSDNFIRFVYLVFFGLGIFGLSGLKNYKIMFKNNSQLTTIYLFSLLLLFTSLFLGGDTSRILLIPSIIFTLIFFIETEVTKNIFLFLCLNLALWAPWVYSTGTEESFLYIYGQRYLETNVALKQFTQFLILCLLIYGVRFCVKLAQKVRAHK